MGTECAERERLRNAYDSSLNEYLRSVEVFEAFAGTISYEDYVRILRDLDKARELWESLRLALDLHLAKHRCAE